MTEGCTPERRQHSKIAVEIGDVSKGGRPLSYRNVDLNHCALDYLRNNGYLGNREDSDVRYDSGMSLRRAYYAVYSSAPPLNLMQGGGFQRFISDEQTEKDEAELRYHRIMVALPVKYRILARSVCCHDTPHDASVYPLVREMLDAVYGAVQRVRDKYPAVDSG